MRVITFSWRQVLETPTGGVKAGRSLSRFSLAGKRCGVFDPDEDPQRTGFGGKRLFRAPLNFKARHFHLFCFCFVFLHKLYFLSAQTFVCWFFGCGVACVAFILLALVYISTTRTHRGTRTHTHKGFKVERKLVFKIPHYPLSFGILDSKSLETL